MKSIIIASILLIAIIGGSVASTYYITNQAELLQERLVELEMLVTQEKWEQSYSQYKNFKNQWFKVDHKWSMLIDHYEIDYINMDLGELESYIKSKDKINALAKVTTLKIMVKHIPEKEYPTLKNIL